jgi:GntR family transcriptional regulator / MocR family aminotransferase
MVLAEDPIWIKAADHWAPPCAPKEMGMRAERWADIDDWHVDRAAAMPLFRQIYQQVSWGILGRTLMPGTKLPSTRDLAERLGVARSSVVIAYEQLLAEGYIYGKVGSGTYISSDLPEPIGEDPLRAKVVRRPAGETRSFTETAAAQSDERPFNLGRTLLDARSIEIWRKLSHRAVRSLGPSHFGYTDPSGFAELRKTISDYLQAARSVCCEPAQVIVTAGTQHAIDIALRVLLDRGDEVWVEDPGYSLTYDALAAFGAKARPIRVDKHGIDVAAGIRAAPKARAVFVTPSHQFPLGVVLSMSRRLELLAWARSTQAWIIEDDYASEFRYGGRPLASLQGLDDSSRVIYIGTLNKALFPGLRMGYVVVPHALLRAFVRARYLMDRQPPSLQQTVVAEFMRQGHFASHLRRMRLQYRDQRDALATEFTRCLGDYLQVDTPDQGMHLVAYLREGLSDIDIERAALDRGIVVRAISRLYRKAPPRSGLMLGFSGYPRQVIPSAVEQFAEAVRDRLMY